VVFADDVRGLVEKVIAGMSNPLMQLGDTGLRFFPIAAECDLAAHASLILCHLCSAGAQRIDRLEHRAVRERRKERDTRIEADYRR